MSTRPAVAALALALLVPPAPALQTGREAREPAPFAWGPRADDLGPLAPPTPGRDGWRRQGSSAFVRPVPSFAGDPTFECVLAVRGERGREVWTRLVLQVPEDFGRRPVHERRALLVLHASGQSERAAFLATELPFVASRRGRMVIAPRRRGPLASSVPAVPLEALLERVHALHPFDFGDLQVLALGEGVLEALELARSAGEGLRVGSMVVHPGLLDEGREDPFAALLGGPSSGRDDGPARGTVPEPIETRPGLPLFLHANLAEPSPWPAERAFRLESALRAGGALVITCFGFEPALEPPWASLPLERALDALDERAGPPPPPSAIAVLARPFGRSAHHRLERAPDRLGGANSAALEVRYVEALRLDPRAAGLDPSRPLTLAVECLDGRRLALVLSGYAAAPALVELDGARLRGWSHDPEHGEVRLETPERRGSSIVIVRP